MSRFLRILPLRLLLVIIAATLANLATDAEAASAGSKKLVILNSYNESAPWSQEVTAHIMSTLSKIDEFISIDVLHPNGPLVHNEEQYDKMAEGVFERYPRAGGPDYVVLLGNMAFSLRDRIARKWGRVPMVLIAQLDTYGPQESYYTYTNDEPYPFTEADMQPIEPLREKYNFTLVHIPNRWKETVDMMIEMFPKMSKLVFLADEFYINQQLNVNIDRYMQKKYPEVTYEWLRGNVENGHKMREYLSNRDFNIGLLFSTWFYEQGSVHGFPFLISGDARMISSARRPVFGLRTAYMEIGLTGGFFPSPDECMANISSAIELLVTGYEMSKVPFYYPKESFPIIDYSQLTKDGLSASICPPHTLFINKPVTFWEENRALIIIGTVALIAFLALIIGYTIAQSKQVKLLEANKQLVTSMPIAYTEAKVNYNPDGTIENLTFMNSNEAFNEILALNVIEENQRRAFYDNAARYIHLANEQKSPVKLNYYFKKPDKYYEFIIAVTGTDSKGNVTKINIFGLDVTDKSKAENDLRDFARKLDLTLSVSRIIPWRWDLVSGKISCEIQRMLHHTAFSHLNPGSQMLNIIDEEDYFSHIHPEDIEKVKEKYSQLVSGKLQYAKLEYRYIWMKNDIPHTEWIEASAGVNSHDAQGNPTGIIGSMLIITQRKLQEEQLITARARAQESERLKSAFLANMSHEIRTPLNAIVGFSNLLTKTQDQDKKEKFIHIIEDNNQLLLQLISDVLDLAKVESNTLDFTFAPTDINKLINTIESTIQMRLQPGVALNCLFGAPSCVISTDSKRLSQVLSNLLTNACKFTSRGNISFGYEMRDDELYFYVKDTGVGIDEENIKRLFKRFVKLDNFVQGTGLGLSICKSIVEKLGGKIGAESKGKDKGSLFWFTIPYNPAKVEEKAAIVPFETKKTSMNRDELTILIAEDNESNYLLFQSILEKDYRLIHAWNGAEAVKLFDQFRPALVIMDINMPVMNGYEATNEIRKLSSDVPILAVTAYAYASDQSRIMQSGFTSYVSKPVNSEKLTHELRSIISNKFILL